VSDRLTPELEKAVQDVLEWMYAALDEYEGEPCKLGENEGKRRYYRLLLECQRLGIDT
jgi:hypothetical protein